MPKLKPGDKAPDFALTDQRGKSVKLKDFRGKKVVVYFYPKADTPGCTTQSSALRDAEPDLKKLKAKVVGISPDTPEKQKKFVRPRVPAPRRREPQSGASVGDVGEEDPVRAELHGHHPLRVRRRREGQARRRVLQGQSESHRPEGH